MEREEDEREVRGQGEDEGEMDGLIMEREEEYL